MLAVHIGMDIFLRHVEMLGKTIPQSGCIQHSTGTDDLILRQSGDPGKYIGQNVHRVADDDVDGVRRRLHDLGRDLLDDVHVGLGQFNSGLSGLAGDP